MEFVGHLQERLGSCLSFCVLIRAGQELQEKLQAMERTVVRGPLHPRLSACEWVWPMTPPVVNQATDILAAPGVAPHDESLITTLTRAHHREMKGYWATQAYSGANKLW